MHFKRKNDLECEGTRPVPRNKTEMYLGTASRSKRDATSKSGGSFSPRYLLAVSHCSTSDQWGLGDKLRAQS